MGGDTAFDTMVSVAGCTSVRSCGVATADGWFGCILCSVEQATAGFTGSWFFLAGVNFLLRAAFPLDIVQCSRVNDRAIRSYGCRGALKLAMSISPTALVAQLCRPVAAQQHCGKHFQAYRLQSALAC